MTKSTLYIVGIGLGIGHLTTEALNVIRNVNYIFMETYTSIHEDIKNILNDAKGIIKTVNRADLEDRNGEVIINVLKKGYDAALIVIGDPMIATSHTAIAYLVRRMGFNVKIINSVSILCASMSQAGLSPYKVGPVATITYPRLGTLSFRAYEILMDNLTRGLHTLLLLDIRDDGSFMKANEAVELLMKMEKENNKGIVNDKLMGIFLARIGWKTQEIIVSSITKPPDLGEPPHAIIVPGELNPVEQEYLIYVLNADQNLVSNHVSLVKKLIRKNINEGCSS